MKKFCQGVFTGERALYDTHDAYIEDSTFMDGESPLKESSDIELSHCIFKWKYPLWYCTNVKVGNTTFLEEARSGIWYTKNIAIRNSCILAPKTFRYAENVVLENVQIPHAQETLWNSKGIKMTEVKIKGDYLGFHAEDVDIDHLYLDGNYAFDSAKNITIRNSTLFTKDAFWNAENVTIINSTIIGEYFSWNSKNVTLINCTVESHQGFCYMDS